MKSLIIVMLAVFSSSAFATVSTVDNSDCRMLVATTATMITDRIPSTKGKVTSTTAPANGVQHVGNSATMFISQVGDNLSIIAGKDQWSVDVTRTSEKGVEVYTYVATTRPDDNGQCMMMDITMIDKRV